MSLPGDFDRECLYGPEPWFVHELTEMNAVDGSIRAQTGARGKKCSRERPYAGSRFA